MKHTIFLRRALAWLLLFTLTLTMALPTLAASSATAADMRLVKTEGKVTVGNQSGKTLSVRDNMKLYSGYTISTDAESYAWLTLDAEKAVKLDASSALEVRKKGKKLELLLVDGKIYFDVSAPLEDGETMNIRTSTMVTGIRGTSGIVATSGTVSSATLLTGAAQVTNLFTGESMLVQAGTVGVVTPTSMASQPVSSIDGFAAKEIQASPDQAKAVEEATGQSVDNADAQLASDQANAAAGQQQLDERLHEANASVNTNANRFEIDLQTMADIWQDGELNKPGQPSTSKPSTPGDSDDSGNTGDTGNTGGSGDSGGTTKPTEIVITTQTSLADLNTYLAEYEKVIISNGGSVTIAGGETLSIPKAKTLLVESEVGNTQTPAGAIIVNGDMKVEVDGTLITNNQGTITGEGKLLVLGDWKNTTDFVFTEKLMVQISGTFDNLGTFTINNSECGFHLEPGSIINNGDAKTPTASFYVGKCLSASFEGTFNNYGQITYCSKFSLYDGSIFNNMDGGTFQTKKIPEITNCDADIAPGAVFNNAGTVILGGYLGLNKDDKNPENSGTFINNGDRALLQLNVSSTSLDGILTNSKGTIEINYMITVNGTFTNNDRLIVNNYLYLDTEMTNNGIMYVYASVTKDTYGNGTIINNGTIYDYNNYIYNVTVVGTIDRTTPPDQWK